MQALCFVAMVVIGGSANAGHDRTLDLRPPEWAHATPSGQNTRAAFCGIDAPFDIAQVKASRISCGATGVAVLVGGVEFSFESGGDVLYADRAEYRLNTREMLLYGSVRVATMRPLAVSAKRIESLGTDVTRFRGEVVVRLGTKGTVIRGDDADYDKSEQVVHLRGNIRLTSMGVSRRQ